ncbi:PilZ domain-containing protein [Candidatus Liberibacter solanacearum]|uniref:PilZ domain-containing protein n=1 Tax=Candidatus Liberibacter solanacearum TaxID=556287 RepID=UPI003871E973
MYRGIHNLQFIDQRAFQRIKVDLKGRFLLFDGTEYDCVVREVSPGGLCITCDVPMVLIGERFIFFVEKIGRIESKVVNFDIKKGYSVRIISSEDNRRKLADNLVWLANKDDLSLQDHRKYSRKISQDVEAQLTLENKTVHSCQVIDISESGVSVSVDLHIKIFSKVFFNDILGRVVRKFPGSVAIEFATIQKMEE